MPLDYAFIDECVQWPARAPRRRRRRWSRICALSGCAGAGGIGGAGQHDHRRGRRGRRGALSRTRTMSSSPTASTSMPCRTRAANAGRCWCGASSRTLEPRTTAARPRCRRCAWCRALRVMRARAHCRRRRCRATRPTRPRCGGERGAADLRDAIARAQENGAGAGRGLCAAAPSRCSGRRWATISCCTGALDLGRDGVRGHRVARPQRPGARHLTVSARRGTRAHSSCSGRKASPARAPSCVALSAARLVAAEAPAPYQCRLPAARRIPRCAASDPPEPRRGTGQRQRRCRSERRRSRLMWPDEVADDRCARSGRRGCRRC